MGVKERRERQKEALRQEILDAARTLFVEQGYNNVSMRKIADKIEYSPTTIYLYFRDKADLLHCVCEETFEKLTARLEAILESDLDVLAGLRRGLRAYIEFGLEHPNHYIMTFMTPFVADDFPEGASYENSAGGRAFGVLRTQVERCVEQGILGPVDIDTASQGLWAAVHGLTSLLIAHRDFPWVDRDALIDHLVESSTAGLRA